MLNVEYSKMSAQDIIGKTLCGKINPDPIAQRPPVTSGSSKSERIVESLISGYGIGMLTLRDIRVDADMQKIYPGVEYLVIDGGHRVRALKDFYTGRFAIKQPDGHKYIFNQLDWLDFNSFEIPCTIVTCSSIEATIMFRNINTTTLVNFMEMVMSNEVSEICKQDRSRVKYYKEYNNSIHPL